MRFEGGALVLGRVKGLDFSIDWSWLILVYLRWPSYQSGIYMNPGWCALDFIVFMLAILLADISQISMCRFVGGTVTKLKLSFLTRGMDLAVPQRPTPVLLTHLARIVVWSFLTAGSIAAHVASNQGMFGGHHDFRMFIEFQMYMFVILAIYNIVPAYPNDGGHVLRATLWYIMGPAWSLRISAALGLIAVCGLVGLAIWWKSYWIGFIAVLMLFSCIQAFRAASTLAKIRALARREDFSCPRCGAHPPESSRLVHCPNGHGFDFFACGGQCPVCGVAYQTTICVDCQMPSSPRSWSGPVGAFPVAPTIAPKTAPQDRPMIDVQPEKKL